MGLMLQPYWSPGMQNLEAKGAILGFGDEVEEVSIEAEGAATQAEDKIDEKVRKPHE